MQGYIGFSCEPEGFSSKFIRWFTRSSASHSFIFYDDKIILEAASITVQAESIAQFKKDDIILYAFKINQDPAILQKALENAVNLLGIPYDYCNLIGMGIVKLVDVLTHIKIKNPLDKREFYQCSEYLLKYLLDSQIPIKIEDKKYVYPQLLIDFCKSRPDLFIPIEV